MTGKCLASNSRGGVYVGACNGNPNQNWYEIHHSDGWTLKDKGTERVLEELIDGTIKTAKDEGYPVQRWS